MIRLARHCIPAAILMMLFCTIVGMPTTQFSIGAYSHIIAESSSVGPTIDWNWGPDAWMAVDGIYQGQTEEKLEFGTYINDSDGVNTVILRVKWPDNENWINHSTRRIDGNTTLGHYTGNITWVPVHGIVTFHMKMFANDTLGDWSETSPLGIEFVYVAYIPGNTPTTGPTTTVASYLQWHLVLLSLAAAVIAIIIWKHVTSRIENGNETLGERKTGSRSHKRTNY